MTSFSYDIDVDDTARAKRRRRTQTSSDVETKALGANLGSLARGAAVFDPNAYDGDGDGLVQDSTPFERPAVLSNIAAAARGFASVAGHWGNDYETWTRGLTNDEVAEIAVPSEPKDAVAHIAAQIGRYGLPRGFTSLEDVLNTINGHQELRRDNRPEAIKQAREILAQALDDRPELRQLIDRFGIPTIQVGTGSPSTAGLTFKNILISLRSYDALDGIEMREAGKSDFKMLMRDLDYDFKTDIPAFISTEPTSIVAHEYGHSLLYSAMLSHPDPDVRNQLWTLQHCTWNDIARGKYGESRPEIVELAKRLEGLDLAYLRPITEETMIPPSYYGTTTPQEFVAETITKWLSGEKLDKNTQRLVDDITGNTRANKGFASVSGPPRPGTIVDDRNLPGSRGFDNMTPEEIAQVVVPSSPEEAINRLRDWAEWRLANVGPNSDPYAEGMTARQVVDMEMWRMYYHMKDKGSNRHWKRNMRKARKKALNNEKVDMGELFDFSEQTVG